MWAEKNNRAIKFFTARSVGILRDFKGRRRFTEPTPSLKIPLRSTLGCAKKRLTCCSAFYKLIFYTVYLGTVYHGLFFSATS